MTPIRRATAAAVGLIAPLALAACGGATGSTASVSADKLVYGTGMFYSSMDPHKSVSTVGDCAITCLFYDRLVHTKPDGTLIPGLAESWEFSTDGTSLTFHLREGVEFDDGTPLDAAAIKASLDRARTLEGSTVKGDLASIADIKAVDAQTVVFQLRSPDAALPGALSTTTGSIINPKAIESGDLGDTPDGTGPYELKSYTADSEMTLARDDDYWGEKPAYQDVVIKWIKDPSALANALQAGQVDAAPLQPANAKSFEELDGFTMTKTTTLGQAGLITNFPLAKITDVKVRQAILHAIDREGNCKNILHGYCEISDQPFPDGYFANDGSIDQVLYPYDPEKAKSLLAEAGVKDLKIQAYVTNPSFVPLAQAVQEQLKAVGIGFDVKTIDTATMAQKLFVEKSLPVVLTPFTGRPDPAIMIGHRYSKTGSFNPGGYTDPAVEAAYKQALTTTDPAAREPVLKSASKAVAESAVGMVMYHPVNATVTKEGIDIPASVSGVDDLRAAAPTE